MSLENEKPKLTFGMFLPLISTIIFIVISTLAQILKIGGYTTGEISDLYKNLITPAGYTFAIWFVIYILLIYYSIDILITRKKESIALGFWLMLANVSATIWIFIWGYNLIPISVIFTGLTFGFLLLPYLQITTKIKDKGEEMKLRLVFGTYFAWSTLAFIQNIASALVSISWDGFGLSDEFWAIAIGFVALLIGIAVTVSKRCIAYGAVFIWAFVGILIARLADSSVNNAVIAVVAISIVFLIISIVYTLYLILKKARNAYENDEFVCVDTGDGEVCIPKNKIDKNWYT